MQNIAVKLDDKWTDIDLDKRLQTRFADQRISNLFVLVFYKLQCLLVKEKLSMVCEVIA